MAMRAMHTISKADSASTHAQQLSDEIWQKLYELSVELKTNRIDP